MGFFSFSEVYEMLPLSKVSWKPFLNEQVIKRLKCKQASKTQAALSQNEPETGKPSVLLRALSSFTQMLSTLLLSLWQLLGSVPRASCAVAQDPPWMSGFASAMHSRATSGHSWLLPCSYARPCFWSQAAQEHAVNILLLARLCLLWVLEATRTSTDREWEWDKVLSSLYFCAVFHNIRF